MIFEPQSNVQMMKRVFKVDQAIYFRLGRIYTYLVCIKGVAGQRLRTDANEVSSPLMSMNARVRFNQE